VSMSERRIKEAQKIGYKKSIIPLENAMQLSALFNNLEIKGIYSIKDLLDIIKKNNKVH